MKYLPVFLVLFFLYSCEKSDENSQKTDFSSGIIITNEGGFQKNNGSVSFFDTKNDILRNNIFDSVNKRSLGDVVQSFAAVSGKGFIVANNSQKIEVVDLKSFASIGVISPFSYPRFALGVNNSEVWVSNGKFQGKIYVIDVKTLKIKDSVDVGFGPEVLLQVENSVFVANSGGWGSDSTISEIDVVSKKVIKTHFVGDLPVDLVSDSQKNIWVLCKGKPSYYAGGKTQAKLVKLDSQTKQISLNFDLGYSEMNPLRLCYHYENVYFGGADLGGIFKMNEKDAEIPKIPFYKQEGTQQIYAFEMADLHSGELIIPTLYVLKVKSFDSNGILETVNENSVVLKTYSAGIVPNGIWFY